MSQKKFRWLRQLVKNYDINLLLDLRNVHGEKTNEMDEKKLYKETKKLWYKQTPGVKNWGKPMNRRI